MSISPDVKVEEVDKEDSVIVDQLRLGFTSPSEDLDAEGEDDDNKGTQQWLTSPLPAPSTSNLDPYYQFNLTASGGPYGHLIGGAYGYPTPPSPAMPTYPQSTLLNYANAAAQIRREAQYKLAFGPGGTGFGSTTQGEGGGGGSRFGNMYGDDGGWLETSPGSS